MDDIVRQAMAKWPQVPDCYGWLGLDTRGHWYMRDDVSQALGAFSSGAPGSKGSLLQHEKLIAFIGRNYAADTRGCWYFQNGPQRVYVELAATPWVWRMQQDGQLHGHTDNPAQPTHCLQDERGWVYFHSNRGLGLLHTLDVGVAADRLEAGQWTVEEVRSDALEALYGFVRSPQGLQKEAISV
jgi:hypothetical protein